MKPDPCSVLIFIDEGRMFHQLLDQSDRFPDTSPILMLTALPFCGLIVHDSVRFMNKYAKQPIPYDSQAVNRLRNHSKSLADTKMPVEEYAKSAQQIVDTLGATMKTHTGPFASVLNALQPDMGIFYYDKKPILTTYIISRYIGIERINDHESIKQLGYEMGQAAAINYEFTNLIGMDTSAYQSNRFETNHIDCHYSSLVQPLAEKGLSNQACFFALSEILTQMNSIDSLRKAGFFSEALYLKFGTSTLEAANKSISKLARYYGKDPESFNCTRQGLSIMSSVMPHETRKRIERIRPLRNAFIHYDFTRCIEKRSCHGLTENEVLDQAVNTVGFANTTEYLDWLHDTLCNCEERMSSLLELPTV